MINVDVAIVQTWAHCVWQALALRPAALAVAGIGGTAEAADALSEAAPSALSS